MKKSLFIVAAVALLFAGSVGLAKAQTAMSDSALLAQLFDIVTDLARAVSSIIEKSLDTFTGNTGSTPATTDTGSRTPVPAPQPVPKPSPEPGVVSFTVTSPAAGDVWTVGRTYEVKWENANPSATGVDSPNFVSVYLVATNSASVRPSVAWTVAAYARNTGSYKWTVSKSMYPGDYMVAIEPYARPDRRTYSDAFAVVSGSAASKTSVDNGTIAYLYTGKGNEPEMLRASCMWVYMGDPPGIGWRWVCFGSGGGNAPFGGGTTQSELKVKITNPSGATDAAWVKGKQYLIKWESTDPSMSPLKETDYLSIYLVSAKDVSRVAAISSKAYNDGDFRWTVSTKLANGMYKIVLQSVANPSLKVLSSQFYVTGAVSTPVSGDTLFTKSGSEKKIGEGEMETDRKPIVFCCRTLYGGACYAESGGTCVECFAWCSGHGN